MHHDGNARALTVLYYLNGVGETWLPLADAPPRPKNGEDAMARAAKLDPDSDGVRVTAPAAGDALAFFSFCLLYTSPSPRDRQKSRMPSSA